MALAKVKKINKEKKSKGVNTRKFIRFAPDPGTFAAIDMNQNFDVPFEPTHFAMVFSESFSGCGLIILKNKSLKEGRHFRVQVGKLNPMVAGVKWRKDLDSEIARIGCVFLE